MCVWGMCGDDVCGVCGDDVCVCVWGVCGDNVWGDEWGWYVGGKVGAGHIPAMAFSSCSWKSCPMSSMNLCSTKLTTKERRAHGSLNKEANRKWAQDSVSHSYVLSAIL